MLKISHDIEYLPTVIFQSIRPDIALEMIFRCAL